MTRRSIYVAIATILALGLLTGLAYGAGHATRKDAPVAVQAHDPRMGSGTHDGRHVGPAFRMQMHDWMHRWMRDHHADHRWHGMGDGWRGAPAAAPNSASQPSTPHHDQMRWGPHAHRSGSYDGDHHDGWHHDCW